jgi:hypothetical protein
MVLMAQSVPPAKRLPCIRSLPLGWSLSGATIVRGRATFRLLVMGGDGGNGSIQLQLGSGGAAAAVDVTLTPTCSPPNGDSATTVMEIDGGCVTYRSLLPSGVGPVPSFDPGGGLSFVPRSRLVAFVDRDENLILCGAEAPCP